MNTTTAKPGLLRVNMAQMKRWRVYSDNVRCFDSIYRTHGVVQTLDSMPYTQWLNEFGIFYTLTESARYEQRI